MTRFERILHEACKLRDSDALRTESAIDGLLDVLGSVLLFDAFESSHKTFINEFRQDFKSDMSSEEFCNKYKNLAKVHVLVSFDLKSAC